MIQPWFQLSMLFLICQWVRDETHAVTSLDIKDHQKMTVALQNILRIPVWSAMGYAWYYDNNNIRKSNLGTARVLI